MRDVPCPAEPLRPILVEFFFVAAILFFKLLLQIIRLLKSTMSPARVFFGAYPGDQFEIALMLMTIAAFAITVEPLRECAVAFVCFPIIALAFGSWDSSCSVTSGGGERNL